MLVLMSFYLYILIVSSHVPVVEQNSDMPMDAGWSPYGINHW